MRRFAQFVEEHDQDDDDCALITTNPCHGGHSQPPKKKDDEEHEKIEESTDAFKHPVTKNALDWGDENDNHHLAPTMHAVHEHLDKSPEVFNSHPDSEHLERYSQASYITNDVLLKKAQKKDSEWISNKNKVGLAKHNAHVKGLDNALRHGELEHDLHVYHGARFNPDELAKQHPQRKIKSPTYLSTSIDKGKAAQFSGRRLSLDPQYMDNTYDLNNSHGGKAHIIHLHLKKGQKGVYLGNNSSFKEEKEFLLPRNTKMQIHPEPTVLHNGTHVWHAHVVKR